MVQYKKVPLNIKVTTMRINSCLIQEQLQCCKDIIIYKKCILFYMISFSLQGLQVVHCYPEIKSRTKNGYTFFRIFKTVK